MKISCPYCSAVLDVGDEKRSVVAICYRTNKTCPHKQWANPKTRVFCATDDEDAREVEKVTHVIQTDPPETSEEERNRVLQNLEDQNLAHGNHPDP